MTQDLELDPARVPLSNRRGTASFFEGLPGQGVFGIDRLSLSFPLRSWETDPTAWHQVSTSMPGTPKASERLGASLRLNDECKVFVGVATVPETGQTWGKIEFNPSRAVMPEGHGLLGAMSLPPVVDQAVDMASSLLEPAVPDAGAMKVRRLDVARDFEGITRPEFIVRGLGPVHRPWARRNLVHFDPARQGAQTLMVGSGAGVVRLYDKNAETGGEAPGVLRWEVEARRDWCQNYGSIETLDDVDASTVEQLGRDRWEWSAMGTEVTALESVVEKVMRSGLSFAEQRGVIGYLTMVAAGADVRAASATHAKYRKVAKRIGVTVDPGSLSDDESGFRARLDLDAGREVLSVG